MFDINVQIAVLTILTAVSYGAYRLYSNRTPNEVFEDLQSLGSLEESSEENRENIIREINLKDPYFQAGIYTDEAKRNFLRVSRLVCLVPPVVIGCLLLLFGLPPAKALLMALMAFGLSFIISRNRLVWKKEAFDHEIEFFLPMVMERLVMATQSGLDLLASIKALLELEKLQPENDRDPVTRFLAQAYELNEAGLPFNDALKEVSKSVDSTSLKHAFLHLGHAHKEGAGVVGPLRELADAAQSQFQDKMEEVVAKLPVKATLPLAICFAGLLACMMTVPIITVIELATKAVPGGG